jgi:hypothetical protein
VPAEELGDGGAHVTMPETGRRQSKETQGVHQGEHAAVAEAQSRGALVRYHDGLAHRVEVVFPNQAVVAQRFDV